VEKYTHDERFEAYKTVVRLDVDVTSVTWKSCRTNNGNLYSYDNI